jgi:hypothetical protein
VEAVLPMVVLGVLISDPPAGLERSVSRSTTIA